jgi:hypothetical protein
MAIAQVAKKSNSAPVPTRVSLNPDSATQGFLDDVDVEFSDALAVMWDYNGQQPEGPALCIEMTDVNGGQHVQYYSAGKAEDWGVTEDNTGFTSISGKTGVNAQTNLMKFMESLAAAGFPKDVLDSGNVKDLVGTKVHINQVVQERKGLIRTGKNADRPSTLLLVSKIHSLPGAEGAGKSAPKAAAGKSSPATSTKAAGGKPNGAATETKAAAADDIDTTLVAALTEALAENDPLPKKELLKLASAAFKGTPQHSKAIARSNAADFLKSLPDNGINFDGSEFSLA